MSRVKKNTNAATNKDGKIQNVLPLLFVVIIGIATFICTVWGDSISLTSSIILSSIIIVCLVLEIIFFAIYYYKKPMTGNNTEYRKYLSQQLKYSGTKIYPTTSDAVQTADQKEDVSNSKTDIIGLMLKNNDETTEYFSISKSQAKSSFLVAIITCIFGVSFLITAIAITLITKQLDLALIPAIGGAITELISGTVLWVHNKSAVQLNHYYDALHENERFLSTVTLVDKLSSESQEEMYKEIIRSQLVTKAKRAVDEN